MVESNQLIDHKHNGNDNSQLEILTFRLDGGNDNGCPALYGINVFKVKELVTLPRLTQKPNEHECAAGAANIRGIAVPVVDLQKYYNCSLSSEKNILILTEFCGSTQGFIVQEVDKIIQLDWKNINRPPEVVSKLTGISNGNTLTGISILPDGELLMILDLEKIILDVLGNGIEGIEQMTLGECKEDLTVFFVDDSLVARTQIRNILDKMNVDYDCAKDGQEALEMLDQKALSAVSTGKPLSESLNVIITDVEMPLMDGYMLTRRIKEDRRFQGIPVVMHSSLSAEQSIKKGEEAGVDAYITKLQPKEFSDVLYRLAAS